MSVRAKLRCNSVEDFGKDKKAKLSPVSIYEGSASAASEEDKAFWEATPSGNIEIYISNPATVDFFKPGKCYYTDFSECE